MNVQNPTPIATSTLVGTVKPDNTTITVDPDGTIHAGSNLLTAAIQFIIDGQGSPIAVGIKPYQQVPFACAIQEVTLLADQIGSITVDVWKCTYAQFDAGTTHPVVGDSITAAATPAIATAKKYDDATLTGWNKTINAGDILGYNVSGVTNITRCTITLRVKKS